MTIVFVAGIHGVGKTTACAAAADRLGMRHLTASEIIKNGKASAISANSKLVADLAGNQQLLVQGIRKLRDVAEPLLLDGHMTLQTASGISPIPLEVFKTIGIAGVVLVLENPERIQQRMIGRGGAAPTLDILQTHQAAEISHAHFVTRALNIPLETLSGADALELANAVQRIVSF